MTSRHRANELVRNWGRAVNGPLTTEQLVDLVDDIERAIFVAVAEEREACAKVARGHLADRAYGDSPEQAAAWKVAGEIAADIEARG